MAIRKILKCETPNCYRKFRMSLEGYRQTVLEAESNGERFVGVLCPICAERVYNMDMDTVHNIEVPTGEILAESVMGKYNWRQIMER